MNKHAPFISSSIVLKTETRLTTMDPNAMYSTSYQEQCLQHDPLQPDQQRSYFPQVWQNNPLDLRLDISEAQVPLMQGHSTGDPALYRPYNHSPSANSPTSSDSSRRHSPDQFPREKQDRRRAQNRAAQRAYRERKEQLRQELEVQVKDWQEKHQALRDSYVDQAQEVQRLKRHIDKLQVQLVAMQDTKIPDHSSLCDFDMWPDFDWKAT